MDEIKSKFKSLGCCLIIPTYNNARFLENVLQDSIGYTDDLIVVNDGSTDKTAQILARFEEELQVLHHEHNQGKGKALKDGFAFARSLGYTHAITMDSDGQHFASDIPSFLDELEKDDLTLVIGARNMKQENVPGKSSFGNRFSNFWFWIETGIKLEDTQSGFRLYPIAALDSIRLTTNKFEFEVEVIVKAAWHDIKVRNIPIKVHYEPGKQRVSHFRPFRDFTRISILNTYLVLLAVLYYIPFRFIKNLTKENIKHFIHQHFLNRDEPIIKKALSIGFGVFMGIVPIWGYQLLVGITLAHLFKLNKVIFVVAANISIPPMIPVIIFLSFKMGQYFVAEPRDNLFFSEGISFETIKDGLWQYISGAVALAVVAGLMFGILSYFILLINRQWRLAREKV